MVVTVKTKVTRQNIGCFHIFILNILECKAAVDITLTNGNFVHLLLMMKPVLGRLLHPGL